MGSSIRPRFTIDIAGQPLQFAPPSTQPFLQLAMDPAQFQVIIPADDSATVWNGGVPTTFDFLALLSDRDLVITFEVNSGASTFILNLRGGGFPLVIPMDSDITKIDVANEDPDNDAIITVFLAQEA